MGLFHKKFTLTSVARHRNSRPESKSVGTELSGTSVRLSHRDRIL